MPTLCGIARDILVSIVVFYVPLLGAAAFPYTQDWCDTSSRWLQWACVWSLVMQTLFLCYLGFVHNWPKTCSDLSCFWIASAVGFSPVIIRGGLLCHRLAIYAIVSLSFITLICGGSIIFHCCRVRKRLAEEADQFAVLQVDP